MARRRATSRSAPSSLRHQAECPSRHAGAAARQRGLGLPRVAIGGITPDNARGLVEAGADLLAVIGGVFDAPDPVAAAHAFRALF